MHRRKHRDPDTLRQRNMIQMKEQKETSEKELNKMEIINLPDKEFKVMVLKIFMGFERKVDELSEYFKKDIENVKKKQSKLKYTIIKMKNTLEGINSRVDDVEQISDVEDRVVESN